MLFPSQEDQEFASEIDRLRALLENGEAELCEGSRGTSDGNTRRGEIAESAKCGTARGESKGKLIFKRRVDEGIILGQSLH